MKLRAETMLRIDELMAGLIPEDAEMIAFEVFRTYGKTNGKQVFNTNKTPRKPVFNTEKHENTPEVCPEGGVGGEVRDVGSKSKEVLEVLEVLEFLNLKAGKKYRPVEENLRFIRARLKTCSVADLKGVIARKTREWLNTEHAKFLRPATLFNATKFEQYIGEQGS